MNISRNSWHYRLADFTMDFFSRSPSNSLCIYFWQVVLSPFILVAGAAIILITLLALAVFVLYGLGCITNDLLVWVHVLPQTFKQLPGIFNYRAIITSVIIDVSVIGFLIYKEYKSQCKTDEDDEKEPNFVVAFVKAKKEKICPFITFKD